MRSFLVSACAVLIEIGTLVGPGRAAEAGNAVVRDVCVGIAAEDAGGADPHAIQEAIDRAAGLGGGTVRIGPGRYVLRTTLTLRSNVRVIGVAGSTVLISCDGTRTRLARDAAHNTDQIVLADDAAFRVGDGVAIRDDRSSSFAVTTATLVEKTGSKTFRLSAPWCRITPCRAAPPSHAPSPWSADGTSNTRPWKG